MNYEIYFNLFLLLYSIYMVDQKRLIYHFWKMLFVVEI